MNGSVTYEGSTLLSGAINVNAGGNIEALNVQVTENGTRTIEASSGVDGYSPITIETNVPIPEPVLDSIAITQNGTYTPPTGTDGYNEINVNVPQEQPNIQSLTRTIASNGITTIHASDVNCDGFDPVTIRTEVPEPVLDSLSVTQNGTYTPPSGVDGYDVVNVDVPLPENAYLLEEYEDVPTDIASFTASDAPLKSLTVSIEPVQAGSGDPSPTNVRPISGWDECKVTRCGKNLITSITEGAELDSQTGTTKPNVSWYVTDYARVEYSKTYYLSGTSSLTVCYYDKTKTFTRRTLSSRTITPQEGEYYVRFNSLISGYSEPQLEEGTEATSFSPFGTTTTIPFVDGQGQSVEVFGGTLDVTSGVLTVDWKAVDFNTLTWTYQSEYSRLCADVTNIIQGGGARTVEFINSDYRCLHNREDVSQIHDGDTYTYGNIVYVHDSRYTDGTAFKNATTAKMVYPMATPTTIQLTPTAVKSLDGDNNVSASTGQIETLEYFTS